MAIKFPQRNYLTFNELIKRWDCAENDIRHAIITESIKPCVKLTGEHFALNWEKESSKRPVPTQYYWSKDSAPYRLPEHPFTWLYLQDPIQTSAFDCEFRLVADHVKPAKWMYPVDKWYELPKPMAMHEVMQNAVFFLKNIAAFESANSDDSPTSQVERTLESTERNSLLIVIAAMSKSLGIDHQVRGVTGQIVTMTEKLGAPLSDDTVRKILKKIPDALELRSK